MVEFLNFKVSIDHSPIYDGHSPISNS